MVFGMFDDHSVQAERQFFLASRCSPRRVQDSTADGLRGVIFPQGLEPYRPGFAWWLEGHVLSVHPKGIAFLLKGSDKLIPCQHFGNNRINILLDRRFPCRPVFLFSQPLWIWPSHRIFSFLLNNRQSMLFAELI